MAGIIAAALAAAGDAGVQSINQEIQRQDVSDRDQAMAKLQTQKEMTILAAQKQARIDEFNQLREQQAARINSASDSIAQAQAADIYTAHDKALTGDTGTGTPLTPEQKQVLSSTADQVAASKPATIDAATTAFRADPETYIRAAMQTGDLTPAQVAQIVQQNKNDERTREDRREDRQYADDRTERQMKHADQLQASSQAFIAGENAKQRAASAEARALDPAIIESNAQAIADGRLAPLSGSALRSPGASAIMARALEINPKLSAKDFAVASKAEKDFATGKQGNAVRSFNVALSHLDTLDAAAKALKNGDMQMLNKMGNMIASQTGAPAPTNFEAVKHIVADEIVKAVTGSAGALGDREAAAKTLEKANSPEQLAGVIGQYKELMVGQLRGLSHQYAATTGLDNFDSKYLSDQARAMITAPHGAAPAPARPGGTTVPNPMQPAAGGVLTYDPKTGTFH